MWKIGSRLKGTFEIVCMSVPEFFCFCLSSAFLLSGQSGFLAADPEVPGSILGAARFSE
jgi:hypothetical protein